MGSYWGGPFFGSFRGSGLSWLPIVLAHITPGRKKSRSGFYRSPTSGGLGRKKFTSLHKNKGSLAPQCTKDLSSVASSHPLPHQSTSSPGFERFTSLSSKGLTQVGSRSSLTPSNLTPCFKIVSMDLAWMSTSLGNAEPVWQTPCSACLHSSFPMRYIGSASQYA